MKRRDFMAAFGAATLMAGGVWAENITYSEGLVQARLDAGETVFLEFNASWCTTCRAQKRVINALLDENAAYSDAITFIAVDWDLHGRSDLVQRYNVPRRSTLIALKGDRELGRIVAGTSRRDIQALLDAALDASTA